MDKLSKTEICMFIGAMIYDVLLLIISSIIVVFIALYEKILLKEIFITIIKNSVCIFLGFIFTILSIHSMKVTIDKALSSNDEKFAKWHTIKVGIIRKVIILIVFIIILNVFDILYVLIFSLSLLGIKISAYIVPFVDKKI